MVTKKPDTVRDYANIVTILNKQATWRTAMDFDQILPDPTKGWNSHTSPIEISQLQNASMLIPGMVNFNIYLKLHSPTSVSPSFHSATSNASKECKLLWKKVIMSFEILHDHKTRCSPIYSASLCLGHSPIPTHCIALNGLKFSLHHSNN